jgi:DNA replication protein DnaC
MNSINTRFSHERKKNENLRFVLPLDYEGYIQLLTQSANLIFEKRREKMSFVIDKYNEHVIHQFYLYLRSDERFEGNLQKGIMLMGKYGCGKTVIWESIVEMYNTFIQELFIQRPMLKFIKSIHLLEILKQQPIQSFAKRPLVIDEFGREPKQIMDFGNLRSPIIELLCERYDAGAWTHGTTNFTLDTLCAENQYGKMTGERIKSMFNFIELKGDSRRK